uniref:NIF system FeS cluster assembly NifU C-terminal domain-containing protein n=1 Tax=Nelumbo nucifera TaxID=4432 RepID=A0A822Y8X4_NELNU|nr:TPA_asm: hypothetical protein HUJ06_027516 [Nelumbo nucifera]
MADEGNVALHEINGLVVVLRLQGACSSCPSSTMTLKMGIETRRRDKISKVQEQILGTKTGLELNEENVEKVLIVKANGPSKWTSFPPASPPDSTSVLAAVAPFSPIVATTLLVVPFFFSLELVIFLIKKHSRIQHNTSENREEALGGYENYAFSGQFAVAWFRSLW